MARLREAHGDPGGALDLLDEAEAHDIRSPLPRVRPIAAMRARVWIAQRRLAEAADWVRDRRLSADDDLTYAREFEHVTLARVLVARHERDGDERAAHDAARLLERLTTAAEDGGRAGTVIETLALQAVAGRASGDVRGALRPLERALALAEPQGYVRVFVDEGGRMRELLRHAAARGVAGEYTRRLLAAFDQPAQPTPVVAHGAGARSVQSLTARELEVLRLIAAGLRNQEIADQLSISPATVKRHVANTYGKLDARHRTDALARARALKLL
jgi:LuxR family maltose regulon positive regulatory protein